MAHWLTLLIGAICAAAIVVGLVVATLLVRVIGQGHLDNDIRHRRRDEFSAMLTALGRTQQRLVDTVSELRSNSESVGASASEIASGSEAARS